MSTPPRLFDLFLQHRNQRRAFLLGGPETFLFDRAADELVERLAAVTRRFDYGVDIGSPLFERLRDRLFRTDQVASLADASLGLITEKLEGPDLPDGGFDLAVSILAMQWFNDLPGVLAQIRRLLKPDGLLLAAMIGGDTLIELRDSLAAAEEEREGGVSPRVSPFVEVRTLGGLLQRAGFALPVTDIDRLTVRYANALDLMRDLRRMGATNALVERSRKPLRRETLLRAAEIYRERYADADGRVRATFEILWLSGWAPHESQQQPLKPGSAKARLADALRAVEIPAGEKTGPKKN